MVVMEPPPPPPPRPLFFQEGKSCIVSKVGDSGLSGNDHRQAEGKESCSFLIKKSQSRIIEVMKETIQVARQTV